ncbi:MAG: hypothetical protein ONB05_04570, partial [candidate division KSB1 bacterium]|nr:hypothetical protein [candidate division KSB1 bacterium]
SNTITVTSSGKAGTSNTFAVNPAALDHFTFATISSPQIAGVAFNITIKAEDQYTNQVTTFSSSVTLSDDTGTLTPTMTGNFVSGQWTGSVTIRKSQTDVRIRASGAGKTGQSNLFNVIAGSLQRFVIDTVSTQFAGEAFPITVTALDANGNQVSNFTGTVSISDLSGTITPKISGNFSAGQWKGNVVITQAISNDIITVTRTGGAEFGRSNAFNVIASSVDHFAILPITSPQIAGRSFKIKVIAQDADSNTVTTFTGQLKLTDLTGTITPTLTGNFVAGVWSDSVKITKSRTGNTITVTNGAKAGTSNAFDVIPAPLHHFTFAPIASPQTAGTPFSITLTAEDFYNNKITSFIQSVNLSDNTGSLTPTKTTNFIAGQWTGSVRIRKSQGDVSLTATYSGITGTSNSFNVKPGALHHLVIRDQAGGFGNEIGDVIMTLDDKLYLYSAGYDSLNNYVRDVIATWRKTGTLDLPSPLTGKSTVLDPVTPGSSGRIRADSTSVLPDSTGIITVGQIAYVKIRTAPGGSGIALGDYQMTADDSLALYAAGYDAGKNYLGEVNVIWKTLGTLTPAILDTSTSLIFSPTRAPATGRIMVQHATARGDTTGTLAVSPGKPVGRITLKPTPATLPADGKSTSDISSTSIRDADKNWVAPKTTLFTVSTTRGTIITPDANPYYQGLQVAASDSGKIKFTLLSGTVGGIAYITVSSVNGSATGDTTVLISSLNILSISTEKTTVSQGQIGVPVNMLVENQGTEGVGSISAGLNFIGPNSSNRNLDYPVVTRTDKITNIPGSSIQTFSFLVTVSETALTDTITIDGWVSGSIGGTVVSDSSAKVKDKWLVQRPAQLRLLRINSFADTVSQGLTNISLSMTVKNEGQASALISGARLTFWSVPENKFVPSDYEVFPSDSIPRSILGNTLVRVNFTVNVAMTATLGQVVIDGEITGNDSNSAKALKDSHADTTTHWIVQNAPIVGITSFKPSQSSVSGGQTKPWFLTMAVRNSGSNAVLLDSARVKFIFGGNDITREYTLQNPGVFSRSGTNRLNAASTDSLKFVVTKTGTTLGLVTVEGSVYLKDERTGRPIVDRKNTGVMVQNPAQLVIAKVLPSQWSATQGQRKDWYVAVAVKNAGEGNITIDKAQNQTYLTFSSGSDFVIRQPDSLRGGGLVLAGGATDTLLFTVDVTGQTLGWSYITARVAGIDDNSGQRVTAISTEEVKVKIEKPAQLQIFDVTNKAPNAPYVNTNQNFKIQVRVKHTAGPDADGIHDIWLRLTSSGPSIDTLTQSIFSLPADEIRGCLFNITAFDTPSSGETFFAKILSARADNTNELVPVSPAQDSVETVILQTPASLKITTILAPAKVQANQLAPWTIRVVVSNQGQAALTLLPPTPQDISIKIEDKIQRDYIIEAPDGLRGGGLTLTGGKIDTLVYKVTRTGEQGGSGTIAVLLKAKDKNDDRELTAQGQTPLFVETSALVQIRTTSVLSYNRDGETDLINTGQTFRLTVLVENNGREQIDSVRVALSSDGNSTITETKPLIEFIAPSAIDSAYFTIKADTLERLERFTARILSGTAHESGLPALIGTGIDTTATIRIQKPATLKVFIHEIDTIFTVNQQFTLKASVINLGTAAVEGTGKLVLRVPVNYSIRTQTVSRSDTVAFRINELLSWDIVTPDKASGPDTIVVEMIQVPKDKNSNEPAAIAVGSDTLVARTLSSKLLINSLAIIAPEGAKDGIVSTGQSFTVQAVISYSQNLKNVAAELTLPSEYEFVAGYSSRQSVSNKPVQWKARAPENRLSTKQMELTVTAVDKDQITIRDSLAITTVAK